MYYRSGTVDAAAQTPEIRFVLTHQVAALFCVNWRHGRHLKSIILVVNRCVFTWGTFLPDSPRSDWNDGALGFLKTVAPTTRRRTSRWVAIWDQFRDLKVDFQAMEKNITLYSKDVANDLPTWLSGQGDGVRWLGAPGCQGPGFNLSRGRIICVRIIGAHCAALGSISRYWQHDSL